MKVIMWMTSTGIAVPGGHGVQMAKTAQALRAAGIQVDTIDADDLRGRSADIVHGFGLSAAQINMARGRGIPVALSTIYWARSYYRNAARGPSVAGYARSLARGAASRIATMAYLRAPWDIDRRVAFCSADLLLPNSHGEAVAIRRELHVRTPMRVVPNGADPTLFSLPMEPVARDRVVYVGRLDPHKNQLGLIEALRGTGLPLLLVGATHPDHRQYADRCYAAARGYAVEFRSHVPHEQLASIYHSARVHAIPSFFETTGLASLEAALCGAAIVTTREGWAREYFGESAIYCRPESAESIRRAVDRAWRGGSDRALPGRIRQHFTWEQAAAETIRAYDALLSRRSMNGSEG